METNLDAAACENNIDANMSKTYDKYELIFMIPTCTGQPQ